MFLHLKGLSCSRMGPGVIIFKIQVAMDYKRQIQRVGLCQKSWEECPKVSEKPRNVRTSKITSFIARSVLQVEFLFESKILLKFCEMKILFEYGISVE